MCVDMFVDLFVGGFVVAPHLFILGSYYAVHKLKTHCQYDESVQMELIRLGKNSVFIDIWNFEVEIYDRRAIRAEAPLACGGPCGPDVSEDSHFGTCHIGTARFGGQQNCTISSYYVQTVRTESRYKRQFGYNSLLFRLKLFSSTRDREWTNRKC